MELTLYYFSAPWCGPCKTLGPIVEDLSNEFKSTISFIKINTDEHPDVAAKYEVRGVPTLILEKNGEIVGRMSGAQPRNNIKTWLKSFE